MPGGIPPSAGSRTGLPPGSTPPGTPPGPPEVPPPPITGPSAGLTGEEPGRRVRARGVGWEDWWALAELAYLPARGARDAVVTQVDASGVGAAGLDSGSASDFARDRFAGDVLAPLLV